MAIDHARRRWCRQAGSALAVIPIVLLGRPARAGANAELRAKLHYRDQPKDGMQCSTCVEFVPGKTDTAPGGCKLIPGDDAISPSGFCDAWNTM